MRKVPKLSFVVGGIAALAVMIGGATALAGKVNSSYVYVYSDYKWTALWYSSTSSTCNFAGSGHTPAVDAEIYLSNGNAMSDAFDGAMVLAVGGEPFTAKNSRGTWLNTGFGTGARTANTVADVSVTREDLARRKGSPTLRSLIKLTNKGSAKKVAVQLGTDLGSDFSTYFHSTSSGDLSFTAKDRWAISADVPKGAGLPSDPVITQVFKGKGKVKNHALSPLCSPSSGEFGIDYTVKLPKKSSRYLLFFLEMSPTSKDAKKNVKKFDNPKKLKPLLKGISKSKQKQILNWDL